MNNQKNWISQLSIILTGQFCSLIGSGIVQFAIIWSISMLQTDSNANTAVALLMGVAPIILFSPFAGVIADKFNRKHVMMIADASIATLTFVFFLILNSGQPSLLLIYILLFLRAVGMAFHQPAFDAVMPMITPEKHLGRVAAIVQAEQSIVRMLSPMLGALLFAFMPLKYILLIDVGTAAIAIMSLLLIRLPALARKSDNSSTLAGYFKDVKIGFQYVYHWKGLRLLIFVFALGNFFLAPVFALMPLVIARYFNGTATDFGLFEMAIAFGILVGSLSLSIWGGGKRKIVLVNIAQVICGALIACIIAVPPDLFFIVIIISSLVGVTSSYVNAPVMAILQTCVEKEMLGRVISIAYMACSLAMPVSLVITGPVANEIGLLPMIWLPGLITLVIGIICFFLPELMRIEDRAPTSKNEPSDHHIPDQVITPE